MVLLVISLYNELIDTYGVSIIISNIINIIYNGQELSFEARVLCSEILHLSLGYSE